MGDPLTKVCLHLVNILVRKVGENYASLNFLKRVFPLQENEVKQYIDSYCKDPVPSEFVMNIEKAYVPIGEQTPNVTGELPPLITFESNERDQKFDRLQRRKNQEKVRNEQPQISTERERNTTDPTPKPSLPRKAATTPIKFTLTDEWMRIPKKKMLLVNSDGSVTTAHLNAAKLSPPANPAAARKFNFNCIKLKNVLIAHEQDANRVMLINADKARKAALQEGFVWNLPKKRNPPAPAMVRREVVPEEHAMHPCTKYRNMRNPSHEPVMEHCLTDGCTMS